VNALSCILGSLIVALAIFVVWASRRGKLPVWATPFGLILMACGGALGLSVVLVDAYPTTYIKNPLPLETEVVGRGEALFRTHCSVCHGQAGRGDGPAAAGLNPKPADLTASHVDDHMDGDLFWWLREGIPGTAMPSFKATLSDSQRWELIRFIRSLRHPLPASASLSGAWTSDDRKCLARSG
jgi:mono/diheme cytochrome c family protein